MQLEQSTSLKGYNTFGIDISAQYFCAFNNISELEGLLAFRNEQSISSKMPLLVLGGGSNVLFTKPIEGLVIKNNCKGIKLVKEDEEYFYVKAAAGEEWHSFVEYCIANNYAGVENLSLIPGSVGASPIQNIGAYGVELKDVFYQLEAYHIEEKHLQIFDKEACAFGYRESVFKQELKGQCIIMSVTFCLPKKPFYNISYGAIKVELDKMGVADLNIQHISKAIVNIRTSKLPNPKEIGNAGSFFKNPQVSRFRLMALQDEFHTIACYKVDELNYKIAAGWLIEQCGWKGYRKGDVGCFSLQALVLVNYGGATGNEILALSDEIIASVKDKFGIVLEREVNVI